MTQGACSGAKLRYMQYVLYKIFCLELNDKTYMQCNKLYQSNKTMHYALFLIH